MGGYRSRGVPARRTGLRRPGWAGWAARALGVAGIALCAGGLRGAAVGAPEATAAPEAYEVPARTLGVFVCGLSDPPHVAAHVCTNNFTAAPLWLDAGFLAALARMGFDDGLRRGDDPLQPPQYYLFEVLVEIGYLDPAAFAAAFGTCPGCCAGDQWPDLDRDGDIDGRDLARLSAALASRRCLP